MPIKTIKKRRIRNPRVPKHGEKARTTFTFDRLIFPETKGDPTSGADVKRYNDIARNPIVKGAIRTLISGIFWPNITIVPQNDYLKKPQYEAIDQEVIDCLEWNVRNMGYRKDEPPNVRRNEGFEGTLKAALYDAMVFGFSVSELKFDVDRAKYKLEAVKIKPPFNFDVEVDQYDEISSVLYLVEGRRIIEVERFIVKPWPELKWGNYYGYSELQSIIHDVKVLESLEKLLMQGVSFNVYKPLILHYIGMSGGKFDITEARKAVRKAKANSIVELPMKTDSEGKTSKMLEVETFPDRASEDTIEMAWNIVQQMILRILNHFGIGESLGQNITAIGSWAKAKTEFDMFLSRVEQGQQWVMEFANLISDTIIYYNYPDLPDDYIWPKLQFENIDEGAEQERIQSIKTAIESEIIAPSEPWIRNRLGFPTSD